MQKSFPLKYCLLHRNPGILSQPAGMNGRNGNYVIQGLRVKLFFRAQFILNDIRWFVIPLYCTSGTEADTKNRKRDLLYTKKYKIITIEGVGHCSFFHPPLTHYLLHLRHHEHLLYLFLQFFHILAEPVTFPLLVHPFNLFAQSP
jgi:hypothetical protein